MKNKMNIQTLITASALLAGVATVQAAGEAPAQGVPAKAADEGITVKLPDLKKAAENAKIKVTGYAQAQYIYADSKNNNHNANSGFDIRRAAISVKGELTEDWSAEVGFEIDSGDKGGKLGAENSTIFVDKAIISYKTDFGKLTAGYQKPAFVMEEYQSSKTQLCIEQSIATVYFTNLAGGSLSGRHGGVWWDGKVSGLKYGVAITNQYKEDMNKDQNDGVAFYGNLGYEFKSDSLKFEVGVNGVYNPGNDDEDAAAPGLAGSVYGLEPFAKISAGGFQAIVDGLYADGDDEVMKDSVFGVNGTLAYRFESGIEPVVRLSYLDAGDNKNIDPSKLKFVPTDGSKDYDSACGVYVGANFYANKYIKISAGYEYTQFDGGARTEDVNAFRLQLQAAF